MEVRRDVPLAVHPLLLSDYAREIMRRKYDAIATDRAYENRPSGLLGPIGRTVDRAVLNFPTHAALRERLEFVVRDLKTEVLRVQPGRARVRVLSAPCGLARDVVTAVEQIKRERPEIGRQIELFGLDLDSTGEVLPLAHERADRAGVALKLARADLFNREQVSAAVGSVDRFHVINCIGLTPWLRLSEVEQLARLFHDDLLVPGGALLIDNFAWHKHSGIATDLEIHSIYHPPEAFVGVLHSAGFIRIRERTTSNNVNTVYVLGSRTP